MALDYILNKEEILINTGNILSLNDITKKPGQNPSDELVEAVTITLKDLENGISEGNHVNGSVQVTRQNDDLRVKLSEHEKGDLKVGLKVFLNSDDKGFLIEAVENAFRTLSIDSVHNVVIAFDQKVIEDQKDVTSKIQNVWKTLEVYVKNAKISQIGLADIEESAFRSVFEWAEIKPTIIQINLATCCVVPPTLQAFCKENGVQLLTHSDPVEMFPATAIKNTFGQPLNFKWAVRFLVHILGRGVLASKGYLVALGSKQ